MTGLGRDAVIRAQKRHGLNLYVLSDEGASLYIALSVAGKDQKTLVRDVTPLGKEALNTIKKKFPGKDVVQPTPPPLDVCSLVSDEDVKRLSKSSEGSGGDGFKEEWTNGASGGRWGCWHLPDEATLIVHVPKNHPSYEALMSAGEKVKGLGAKAYWKPPVREPSTIYGQLYVVSKNGKSFGIDVDFYEADDQAHKDLAVEVAKIILTRI